MTVRPKRVTRKGPGLRGNFLGTVRHVLHPLRPIALSHRIMCIAELPWRRDCFAIQGASRGLSYFLVVLFHKAPFSLFLYDVWP